MHAMENKQDNEFYSIVMPGQNGAGGDTFVQNNVVNTRSDQTYRYQTLQGSTIDLGQGNCIADFERQYNNDPKAKNKKRLFYGVSQGTATLTNWLAKKTHKEQNETAKLLVLEGVLGSGNSGIMHTIHSVFPTATYLPFARLWLPLVAKFAAFRTYNPLGKQAISSAKKLSPALPVVIMHNQGDPQLSINDAREYYCTLREQGNDNAYLIETNNGAAHFDILQGPLHDPFEHSHRRGANDEEIATKKASLQEIYKKHGLPSACDTSSGSTPVDHALIAPCQPAVQEVRQRISATNGYKNVLRNAIDIMSGALILGGIWWKYFAKK
jgi:hypothetical protein